MTRARRAIALALSVATLAACSGGDDDATEVSEPPTTSEETTTTTTTTVPDPTTTTGATTSTSTTTTLPPVRRQPLTGAPIDDVSELIRRPALVVKIDNAPGARSNQSGLAVADIVFEEIVEGSITRFAAVFHSQGSDVVGPIRSGRTQDVDLFTSFGKPLFAWSGGNPGVTRIIADARFIDLNAVRGGEGYYRGAGSAPHNLYNSTERLWEQTPDNHANRAPRQFQYVRPGESFSGEPVAGVDVAMRGIDVEWRWDEDEGRFLRSQEGGSHNDAQHGRIGAANVVVMVVEYRPSSVDARSPEAQTVGEGPVYVFSDGELIEGRWQRDSASMPIRLLVGNGNRQIELTPGNTWIELAEADITDTLLNATADVTVIPAD